MYSDMLLKTEQPKMLSEVIGIISELVTEVKLKLNKDGLTIIAVDPANVAMIIFKVPASAFSQFEAGEETIGINLEILRAVLKICTAGSSLIMKNEDGFLKIEIVDKIKREFMLSILDLESKDKPIPELEFATRIEMNSLDFAAAIEDCAIVSDSCGFEAEPTNFFIFAKGPINSAKLSYSSDEIDLSSAIKSKSRYSIEYLMKMTKAAKITDKAIINFSTDYPLKLEFKNQNIELGFILAPRIETED